MKSVSVEEPLSDWLTFLCTNQLYVFSSSPQGAKLHTTRFTIRPQTYTH